MHKPAHQPAAKHPPSLNESLSSLIYPPHPPPKPSGLVDFWASVRAFVERNLQSFTANELGDIIVFAEVKTRSTGIFGEPFFAVTREKQKRTIAAANAYMEKHDVMLEARFDIISIVVQGDRHRVDHLEEAYYPRA